MYMITDTSQKSGQSYSNCSLIWSNSKCAQFVEYIMIPRHVIDDEALATRVRAACYWRFIPFMRPYLSRFPRKLITLKQRLILPRGNQCSAVFQIASRAIDVLLGHHISSKQVQKIQGWISYVTSSWERISCVFVISQR